MKLSPKQKKWLKRIAILLLLRFIIGGILYYVIVYRFKNVMQYVVKKESGNNYMFDASDIEVSLWKKNIVLTNAVLSCKDTINTTPHYNVNISRVYLAIASWSDLIFHRRVSVDSLAIVLPSLSAHEHDLHPQKQVSFRVSQVSDMLHKLMLHLQVRAFSLQNGSFAYAHKASALPFISDHINFFIRNFSGHNAGKKLLAADEIDLRMNNQHWQLPGSDHEVTFKNLHFSGSNQRFELDSFTFRTADTTAGAVFFSADKLVFNSTQLSDLYEKDKLVIDTLLLHRPIITLQATEQPTSADTTKQISQSFRKLFKRLTFHYINISEGALLLQKKNNPQTTYLTQRTDLKIYGLQIQPESSHITTDSIQLKLRNLRFITRDSMFQMTIDEFAFHNNEVIFSNTLFSPTTANHNSHKLTFRTPSLHLKDISLEDLLHKKLTGTSATLYRPQIAIEDKGIRKTSKSSKDISNFYNTLHGLRELIDVDSFNIINGNVQYAHSGSAPLQAHMNNINASVLLNSFFESDSLIDIKRSLPKLQIGTVNVSSPSLQLSANNYNFDGSNRHNGVEQFRLQLANRNIFEGKKVYWEIFDWDLLQRYGMIRIENLRAAELTANITAPATKAQPGNLPDIFIRRIDVNRLYFHQQHTDEQLVFDAKNICLSNISSKKQFLYWENIEGELCNIRFSNQDMNVSVQSAIINNHYEHVFKQALLQINKTGNSTYVQLPLLKINADLPSTDLSSFHIRSLQADNPTIDIRKTTIAGNTANANSKLPVIAIDKATMVNAIVRYTAISGNDSNTLHAILNIAADKLKTGHNDPVLFSYNSIVINGSAINFNGGNTLTMNIPGVQAHFTHGNIQHYLQQNIFSTAIALQWKDAQVKTTHTDSTAITIEKLSGSFNDEHFRFDPSQKISWQSLYKQTAIQQGDVYYRGKDITARLTALQWATQHQQLSVGPFSVMPNLNQQDAFRKKGWQTDYITAEGEALHIQGITFNLQPNDSSLIVKKVTGNNITLTTVRDKRMPFKHGIEKPMPTKLIKSVQFPFHIDTVLLQQCAVMVHEISLQTEQEGIIPLQQLNALITNVGNTSHTGDSLSVTAAAMVLSNRINFFHYKEAYHDSLSGFRTYVYSSPMELPRFSDATTPLAAITVLSGRSDTLFTTWTGNKHAAIGTMGFYYNNLAVKILDKKNAAKKSFLLALENTLANKLLLNRKNARQSVVFFERDKEKFVFNYWVKTTLSGFMSSIGLKRNKKYNKKYREVQDIYSLPVLPE